MKKTYLLVILLFLLAGVAYAHQPRMIENSKLIDVNDPEISKAYYGYLDGSSAVYEIESETTFNLYVNLLLPYKDDARKDMSFELLKDDEAIFSFDGSGYEWNTFHEEYSNNDYYMGAEFRQEAGPGRYSIRVFDSDNKGKYVLAVGEKEKFTFKEMINAAKSLPKVKSFFNEPLYLAYYNKSGKYLLGAIVLLMAVLIFLRVILKGLKIIFAGLLGVIVFFVASAFITGFLQKYLSFALFLGMPLGIIAGVLVFVMFAK